MRTYRQVVGLAKIHISRTLAALYAGMQPGDLGSQWQE